MAIFLNTILRHVLSVCTLMFVILPFVNTMTQGSIAPGAMAASFSLPNIQTSLQSGLSAMIPNSGVKGFAPMVSGGGVFVGGGRPIFLN